MKIYHSLDFEANKKRVEKYSAGKYIVHAEDFESINDLVERALKTHTKIDLNDFKSDKVEYDEKDVFLENLKEETGQLDTPTASSEGDVEAERSDAATPPADEAKAASADAI